MPDLGGVPVRVLPLIASEPAQQGRAAAEDQLAAQIATVHADSGGVYGSPRVTVELRTNLVIDALNAAIAVRGGHVDGVIFHSDKGSQYGSADFTAVCNRHGIRRSTGRPGSSYDNALAESFFAMLKRELDADRRTWTCETDARRDLFRWIAFYNHRRRHSALDYLSPADYERSLTSITLQQIAA